MKIGLMVLDDFDEPNPFAVDRSQPVDPDLLQQCRTVARQLAAGGAVLGSISKKLQTLGMDATGAETLAMDAIIARSRFDRIIGALIAVAGVITMVVGYGLFRLFVGRIPIAVAMLGAFVFLLGITKACHRSRVRPTAGKPRRMR